MRPEFTPKDIERFWSKVEKSPDPDGCWLWTASKDGGGYGHIGHNGKTIASHIFSWRLANGGIPAGLYVLHTCDVRICVRPDHLWLGTARENMQDCISKGRFVVSLQLNPALAARGIHHGQSKLTEHDVAVIRARFNEGGITMTKLAEQFGVSRRQIGNIVRDRHWLHILG